MGHSGSTGTARRLHHYQGAGLQQRLVQGSRLPSHYRSSRCVVRDWHRHRLHRPPPGYHWVQYGRDYMLVAIVFGVIAQLLSTARIKVF